ncbi:MAG: hypothetical protein AAF702_27460 [Chloroflexota bacterium]
MPSPTQVRRQVMIKWRQMRGPKGSKVSPLEVDPQNVKPHRPLPEIKKSLEDTLWDKLGKRQISWDTTGRTFLTKSVRGEIETIKSSAQSTTDIDQVSQIPSDEQAETETTGRILKKSTYQSSDIASLNATMTALGMPAQELGNLLKDFAVDIGLTAPVLRQVASVGRVVMQAGLTGLTVRKLKRATTAQDYLRISSEYAEIASQGLIDNLFEKLEKQTVYMGTYTFDAITSFVDPTGASGIPTASARLIYQLNYLYQTWKMTRKVNEMLADRKKFDIKIVEVCPLLGCYLFDLLETSQLLGFFDDYDTVTVSGEQAAATHGNLPLSVDEIREEYKKYLYILDMMAKARILASPFVLLSKEGEIPAHLTIKKRIKGKVT